MLSTIIMTGDEASHQKYVCSNRDHVYVCIYIYIYIAVHNGESAFLLTLYLRPDAFRLTPSSGV